MFADFRDQFHAPVGITLEDVVITSESRASQYKGGLVRPTGVDDSPGPTSGGETALWLLPASLSASPLRWDAVFVDVALSQLKGLIVLVPDSEGDDLFPIFQEWLVCVRSYASDARVVVIEDTSAGANADQLWRFSSVTAGLPRARLDFLITEQLLADARSADVARSEKPLRTTGSSFDVVAVDDESTRDEGEPDIGIHNATDTDGEEGFDD